MALPVGKWSKLVFAQYEENGIFYNRLTINGNKLSSGRNKCAEVMINTTPRTFENVQVREEMKIQI